METRCYTFGVYYLSSIQQGIQAAHAIADMMARYADKDTPERELIMKWAREDKTMICLNAGNHKSLLEIAETFEKSKYPCALFQESYDDLGSIYTCLAVVLTEPVYTAAAYLKTEYDIKNPYRMDYNFSEEKHAIRLRDENTGFLLDNEDLDLARLISKKGLAR